MPEAEAPPGASGHPGGEVSKASPPGTLKQISQFKEFR